MGFSLMTLRRQLTLAASPKRAPAITAWVFGALAFVAMAFGAALGIPEAKAANAAESFVQQNIDKGFSILDNKSLSDAQRREELHNFLASITDIKRIALFTLGPYVRTASEGDVNSFVNAFSDYVDAFYERAFSAYTGQSMKVTGSTERSADDVIVNAQVMDPKKGAINVAFRVRKDNSGRNIITDLQVEGAFLAVSKREDFTSFLQSHGGSVPALSAELKKQANEIRTGADPNKMKSGG